MDQLARLKWVKEEGRFAAYPIGRIHPGRYAAIWVNISRSGSWCWAVKWEGWFSQTDISDGKQAAADAATATWWRLVNTDPPRDIDLEAAMIVARALVRPVPNSLFDEDALFLRKVMWHLANIYRDEMHAACLPQPVQNLYDQLTREFARRRETGEIPDMPKGEPISSGYSRRRRR